MDKKGNRNGMAWDTEKKLQERVLVKMPE